MTKANNTAWQKYSKSEYKEVFDFSKGYIDFLSNCKTERECVVEAIAQAKEKGYMDLNQIIKENKSLKSGDKVYINNYGKAVALFLIGEDSLESGMRIIGSHVDSPRLDLKQNPFFEEGGLAMCDTHYYGGIKKYQWVTTPLALHGVVV